MAEKKNLKTPRRAAALPKRREAGDEKAEKNRRKEGLFITFEGGEGSGKSTQMRRLAEALRQRGFAIAATREPGGTAGAEALRHVLLNAGNFRYSPLLEAVLFAAARRDHIEQVIAPALAAGAIVLCDRFMDSTRVYQGLAGNAPKSALDFLEEIAIAPYRPQLSLFLDIAAKTGMARAAARRRAEEKPDRFEKDSLKIQEQRRQAFLKIARKEPERCHIIDADREEAVIAADILSAVLAKTGNAAEKQGEAP